MTNDILQVQGIHEKGFGTIPKLVMQDRRLTAQAKAIYSYFCSYAGSGKTAFPRIDRIISDLVMSKNCYYKHFSLLKKFSYIKVEQEKSKTGLFARNIYTIMQVVPYTKNSETVKVKMHGQPCTNLRDTEKRDTVNCDTNINSLKNKQVLKNISLSSQAGQDGTDENAIQGFTELLKENISYSDLAITHANDLKLIDEMILVMLDAITTIDPPNIRIKDEYKPRAVVKNVLLKLDYEDIAHVLWQFKSVTTPIKKKKQYLLTMLFNCKHERNAHDTNLFSVHNGGAL